MDGQQTNTFNVKEIAYISMLTAILFIQEELLVFLPNIQLTIFLLILYSKKLGFLKTTIIIVIHVILDNLVMGSFNLFYTPAMFVGWMFIPIIVCTIGKKTENVFALGVIGIVAAFLYSWVFIIPNYLILSINPLVYLASDVLFEVILAVVGFLTTVLLYKPCSKIFDTLGIGKDKKKVSE